MDIAQVITDRIIAELEKGAAPWVKPWKSLRNSGRSGMAHNPASGTVYRGINQLWLGMVPGSGQFLTFKQAQGLGGFVKAGTKGIPVVYWGHGERLSADGEKQNYAFLKSYYVFRVEDCEDLILPEPEADPVPTFEPMQAVNDIVDRLGLAGGLVHGGDGAYFAPGQDRIQMPPLAAFDSAAAYHATLLHEAVHASGHKSRLDRLTPARFGSADYAFEELVAELGAAMLCGQLGIDGDLRHAGYIDSWLKALRSDKRCIITAASKAQAAVDYLMATKTSEESIAA